MDWIFILLPCLIWLVLRLTLPNHVWDMDFDTGHGTFAIMLGTYLKFVGLMVVAGLGMALLGRWQHEPDGVVAACLAGALYAFLFALHTTIRYELYLHSRYPRTGLIGTSPYTTAQYAMTHALAWSAVAFTIYGVGATVWLWAS